MRFTVGKVYIYLSNFGTWKKALPTYGIFIIAFDPFKQIWLASLFYCQISVAFFFLKLIFLERFANWFTWHISALILKSIGRVHFILNQIRMNEWVLKTSTLVQFDLLGTDRIWLPCYKPTLCRCGRQLTKLIVYLLNQNEIVLS